MLRPLEQLGQLGDVRGDAPCLVAGHQACGRSPAGFIFEVDIGERVSVGVADDVAPLPSEALGQALRRTMAAGSGERSCSVACGSELALIILEEP